MNFNIKHILGTLLTLFACSLSVQAQMSGYKHFGTVRNLVNADNKSYHFGFILGFNAMDFNVYQSNTPSDDGRCWYADQTGLNAGFTVGIISDLRLGEYFDLRFNPVLMFNDRVMSYVSEDGEVGEDVTVKSSIIDFPLFVKLRAQRSGNFRPYLLAGPAATLDLGRSRDCSLLLKQMDYGIEFGFGCDIYLPYFKLAPEVKMFMGLNDMLDRDRPEISSPEEVRCTAAINKLTSRILTFTFNFE